MVQDLPGNEKRFIQKAMGIEMTIVNGQVLVEKGDHTRRAARQPCWAAATATGCRRRRKKITAKVTKLEDIRIRLKLSEPFVNFAVRSNFSRW